ncbi:uncharacterized membrane protein yuid [Phtheirospermum japonicum]|uniref:Uncharacterized membrane protein yuid n=1 Tax=Phtheirospermum japonicum TaxID=374723 RepID=A0A830DJ25_9LAMI|nr:uncharacterized membrane protein yuid [Phtheirospermum japonicum]
MLLQICDFLGTPFSKRGNYLVSTNTHLVSSNRKSTATFRCISELACHSITVDGIAGVLHNKVLVAAGLSAAIGQLSKPLTSTLFYGNKFDFKAAVQAGGFPSTHSSAVVATATSLVLERGFSDSIFGLAVVYAGLIMYDAQGVRREVGTHAKELNKVLIRTTTSSNSTSSRNDAKTDSSNIENIDSLFSEEQNPTNSSLLLKSDNRMRTSNTYKQSSPLKETIGHTEIEVAAGALLGFLVSLVVCPYV